MRELFSGQRICDRRNWAGPAALAAVVTIVAAIAAKAQPAAVPVSEPAQIWDVVFGTHVSRLPQSFVPTACADGVSAAGRLQDFRDFADCPVGEEGLHAVRFVHDDVDAYVERARRTRGGRLENGPNEIEGQPVIFTMLIDLDGRVQGYRVETANPETDNTPVVNAILARFETLDRLGVWAPPETYVAVVEGVRQKLIEGPVVPSVELEVLQLDRALAAALGTEAATPLPDDRPRPPYANRFAAFMAGASADCPGCNLAEFDLRWRDLSNGDLSGAILTGAILHGADLSNADLSGADLRGANLNRTIVTGTSFTGATLESAMLFAAEGAGANFTGAGLRSALIGDAMLPGARFDGASLDGVDLGGAVLTGASFFFATLRYASLTEADLTGADLRGALASDAVLTGAILAQADATDAVMERVDFRGADFTGANLTRAGLAEALLQGARLDGATLTDARLAGAIMPDGAIVGSSRVDLQACKLEYSIVSPK